jgi:UV DNA damage endonuclease
MINKFGYACININLKKQGVKINRKMIAKTFQEKGIEYAGELAYMNIQGVAETLKWNAQNGILAYRMSSAMFPWMSEYEFKDLPQYKEISELLASVGQYAKDNDIRLSFHPGAFTILCSPRDSVVIKAIKELNQHSEIMDMMGLEASPYNNINIHIGGAYDDKPSTLDKFCENFQRLNPNTKSRLTVENDDRASLYTVQDLIYVHEKTGIPIVFDFHHYDCHPGELSKEDSLRLALSTWPSNIIPEVHMSSSKRNYEDNTAKVIAHADYIYDEIPSTGTLFDVTVEAKMKEQAVLRYINEFKKSECLNEIEVN